tara:strand:+ start:397 stop:591 length:195 start_codon:yes stop_codon:yes gene_type:complete
MFRLTDWWVWILMIVVMLFIEIFVRRKYIDDDDWVFWTIYLTGWISIFVGGIMINFGLEEIISI